MNFSRPAGQDDRSPGANHGGVRFEKQYRSIGHGGAELANVLQVVLAHAHYLRSGNHRCHQANIPEFQDLSRRLDILRV